MRERIELPGKNCKGIKDEKGICCICRKTWLSIMLFRWGEYLICSGCLKKEREKE